MKIPMLILLSFMLPSIATSQDYAPLTNAYSSTDPTDLDIHDEQRDRDIPIRVFLPNEIEPAPTILFSHGLGGSRRGCNYLGEHWSSKGYVVIFIQHSGSDETVWKDVPVRDRLAAMREAANARNTIARFDDVKVVIDRLEQWNGDQDREFGGRMDLQNIGMAGHSYGASTTQGVSGQSAPRIGQRYTDQRIKAALMLSPNRPARTDPDVAFGSVSVPWMLMTGTRDTSPINDTTVEDRRSVYPALPNSIDKYELVLHEGEHFAFSDGQQPNQRRRRNPNHHRVILALSTAFWDWHLRNDEQARDWLHGDGPREVLEDQDIFQLNENRRVVHDDR